MCSPRPIWGLNVWTATYGSGNRSGCTSATHAQQQTICWLMAVVEPALNGTSKRHMGMAKKSCALPCTVTIINSTQAEAKLCVP